MTSLMKCKLIGKFPGFAKTVIGTLQKIMQNLAVLALDIADAKLLSGFQCFHTYNEK